MKKSKDLFIELRLLEIKKEIENNKIYEQIRHKRGYCFDS